MMKMFFHFGLEGHLLFKDLILDSSMSLTLSCLALFVLSILYEFIKFYRSVRCGCDPANKSPNSSLHTNGTSIVGDNCSNHQGTILHPVSGGGDPMVMPCQVGRKHTKDYRLLQTSLHILQTIISYLLMLAVMTYNVCIISAIISGTAVGYFIFYRAYTELEAIESCH